VDLERCRKDAKTLLRAFRAGDGQAIARAEAVLGERARERFQLSDAQHVVAVEHGYRSWPELTRAGTGLDAALVAAARDGREADVERLLEEGADPSAALHAAVQSAQPGTIVRLLAAGADPGRRDPVGNSTPAEWALHNGRRDLAGLIEGIDTGLEYRPGEPVRLAVSFRRHRYVADEGRALELAGRPDGWRAVAERVADERIVNVSRSGVVSLPVVDRGPGFDSIVERVAAASVALYEELLDLE
jgi:hypothetical protein